MFQIVAIPFDAFQALPCATSRWLLTCFSRYVDRDGKAYPSLRQLARDARMSLASVSRYMTSMEQLGVFQRERKPGGRYHYVLAEVYRPHWPGRLKPAVSAGVSAQKPAVPTAEHPVPHAATQQVNLPKQIQKAWEIGNDRQKWQERLNFWRKSRGQHWNPLWGPRPDEPGCWLPAALRPSLQQATG